MISLHAIGQARLKSQAGELSAGQGRFDRIAINKGYPPSKILQAANR